MATDDGRDLTCNSVLPKGHWSGSAVGAVSLDYAERFLRRKRVPLTDGGSVLVDLAQTVSLGAGDGLDCGAGGMVAVLAAPEPLLRITGDLPRLAWHIGNRHTPCAIARDHLLIRDDHVLRAMLEQLGAEVSAVTGPFTPEGGAYGHGRTHGHAHDHDHHHEDHNHYGHHHGHGRGGHSYSHDHGGDP